MSSHTKATNDHEEIRRFAEERNAKPVTVARTHHGDDVGVIRLDFPGFSGGEGQFEEITWDQWFEKFEQGPYTFLYQDVTAEGAQSNFNRLVKRGSVEETDGRESAPAKKAPSRSGKSTKKAAKKAVKATKKAAKGVAKKTAAKKAVKKAVKKTVKKTTKKAAKGTRR